MSGPGLDDVIAGYARKMKIAELRNKIADAAIAWVKCDAETHKGPGRVAAIQERIAALVAELDGLKEE